MLAFRRLYGSAGSGEEAGREPGGRKDGDAGAAGPDPAPAPAFPAPFGGLLWAGPGGAEPAAAAAQAPAPADVSLTELATELIGRLLVKDGDAPAAGQEIRILLRHCALEGTEVHFRRGEDGLQLNFLPDSPAGGELLRRKTDSLEGLLRSRLGSEAVKVSIVYPDAGHAGHAGGIAAGSRG